MANRPKSQCLRCNGHIDETGELVGYRGADIDITERVEYQQRLKSLVSELTIAEERERHRISADLHDNIGQALALARIQLSSARKSISDSQVAAKLDEASASILKASQDIRHHVYDLSFPSLNELGLEEAIDEWLEEEIRNRHGLETRCISGCTECPVKCPMDGDVKTLLFRSVRELLTNVVKHAEASRVTVRLERASGDARIIVEDDGAGFDVEAEAFKARPEGGFGLFSIKERMINLGGSLEITSQPGKGCRAVLSAPCGLSGTPNQETKS